MNAERITGDEPIEYRGQTIRIMRARSSAGDINATFWVDGLGFFEMLDEATAAIDGELDDAWDGDPRGGSSIRP